MGTELKFCLDCRWHVKIGSYDELGNHPIYVCHHVESKRWNLVTGDFDFRSCKQMRQNDLCGQEGQLWEPKP